MKSASRNPKVTNWHVPKGSRLSVTICWSSPVSHSKQPKTASSSHPSKWRIVTTQSSNVIIPRAAEYVYYPVNGNSQFLILELLNAIQICQIIPAEDLDPFGLQKLPVVINKHMLLSFLLGWRKLSSSNLQAPQLKNSSFKTTLIKALQCN